MLASLLSWLGSAFSACTVLACPLWFSDEPEMPRSLIEK